MISLLAKVLIPFIEKELIKHSPEIQDFLLNEIATVTQEVAGFIDSKLKKSAN